MKQADKDRVAAWRRIRVHFDRLAPMLPAVWHEGDGYGGAVVAALMRVAEKQGLPQYAVATTPPGQKLTPTRIRIECLKRDGHRCVVCGGTLSLRACRRPEAVGRQVISVDQVVTACARHANSVRAGTAAL